MSKAQQDLDRDTFERKVAQIYSFYAEKRQPSSVISSFKRVWYMVWVQDEGSNCQLLDIPAFSPFWHYYWHENWKRAYTFVINAQWTIAWPIACFVIVCLLTVTGLINYVIIAKPILLAMLGFVVFSYFWINLRIDMNDNHIEDMIRNYKRRADSLAKNYIHI